MANLIPFFNRPFYILNISYYIINMSFYIISTQYYGPKYQMKTFPKNQPSNLGCYFWQKHSFFELVIFQCFLPNPYTRMCVSTIGSFSLFRKKWKIIVNYKSDLGFLGFLWFSISLLIWIIYKGNRFGDPHKNAKNT